MTNNDKNVNNASTSTDAPKKAKLVKGTKKQQPPSPCKPLWNF